MHFCAFVHTAVILMLRITAPPPWPYKIKGRTSKFSCLLLKATRGEDKEQVNHLPSVRVGGGMPVPAFQYQRKC